MRWIYATATAVIVHEDFSPEYSLRGHTCQTLGWSVRSSVLRLCGAPDIIWPLLGYMRS